MENKKLTNEPSKEEISEGHSTRKNLQKPFSKLTAEKRRFDIIEKEIRSIGFRNARKRTIALSKKYQISERTIYSDFAWIVKNIKPEDREEIKITVRIAIDKALDVALLQLTLQPTIENAQKVMAIAKAYREELEAWGEKEKVPDKQQIEFGQTFSKEEIENEIKRLLGK